MCNRCHSHYPHYLQMSNQIPSENSNENEPKQKESENKVVPLQAPGFNPEMLILAREARGLSQKELAEKLDISQSKISKLEDGLLPAIPEQELNAIAEVLHFLPSFFMQPGKARAACGYFYRKASALPAKFLSRCNARMNVQRLHIERLSKSIDLETNKLPHLDPDELQMGPAQAAQMLRQFWGVPSGPVANLTELVEDAGCIVVHFDFGTNKLDGLSLCSEFESPIIFLNSYFPGDRMRFTLAHELAHIIMHRIPKPDMDDEANKFAAEFLMPENEIKGSFYPVSLDVLARKKLYWKTSMQCLLKRGGDLGEISERYGRFLWMQMGKFGYRSTEPHSEKIEREMPRLLNEMIEVHLNELDYSPDDLAKVLGIYKDDFEATYNGPTLKVA
jgi:Zn-dependent peptidase ImmA (M78 family)/transcriptional regulator with XRE-family HTH domain